LPSKEIKARLRSNSEHGDLILSESSGAIAWRSQ
jgi:hypothetical protein